MGVDLLAVSLLERGAEQAVVFLQDLRVPAVAEALEERGGPLDVSEEEGDRPGRQGGYARPPFGGENGAANLRATFGGGLPGSSERICSE